MSREDEMRKGAEVIQRHLREPDQDSASPARVKMIGTRTAPKTLAGVPRRHREVTNVDAESERLKRLAVVREWDYKALVCMIPYYSVKRAGYASDDPKEIGMQAVRVGGVFFEEPEDVFPSETMFANLALAVKAGVTDKDEPAVFSVRLPGDKP